MLSTDINWLVGSRLPLFRIVPLNFPTYKIYRPTCDVLTFISQARYRCFVSWSRVQFFNLICQRWDLCICQCYHALFVSMAFNQVVTVVTVTATDAADIGVETEQTSTLLLSTIAAVSVGQSQWKNVLNVSSLNPGAIPNGRTEDHDISFFFQTVGRVADGHSGSIWLLDQYRTQQELKLLLPLFISVHLPTKFKVYRPTARRG